MKMIRNHIICRGGRLILSGARNLMHYDTLESTLFVGLLRSGSGGREVERFAANLEVRG